MGPLSLSHPSPLLPMQAIEFFFFAACIGVVAILFAVMSFFYKYVDLSTYNQPQEESSESSDETRALIMSDSEQQGKQQKDNYTDDKGNESEF